ncbi:hypothetical protein CYMTET_35288 [Cymbomonas tetramitiformis]|uniref:Uncharacterized protein n=1 Tax=Cymbomonas tetramitiformis TaxID=36881 RepID=A0AAE0F9G6_9CHLO|nr:hypothetical protein CYMTET_35288 [Cymbomonas tetramitiformis]
MDSSMPAVYSVSCQGLGQWEDAPFACADTATSAGKRLAAIRLTKDTAALCSPCLAVAGAALSDDVILACRLAAVSDPGTAPGAPLSPGAIPQCDARGRVWIKDDDLEEGWSNQSKAPGGIFQEA